MSNNINGPSSSYPVQGGNNDQSKDPVGNWGTRNLKKVEVEKKEVVRTGSSFKAKSRKDRFIEALSDKVALKKYKPLSEISNQGVKKSLGEFSKNLKNKLKERDTKLETINLLMEKLSEAQNEVDKFKSERSDIVDFYNKVDSRFKRKWSQGDKIQIPTEKVGEKVEYLVNSPSSKVNKKELIEYLDKSKVGTLYTEHLSNKKKIEPLKKRIAEAKKELSLINKESISLYSQQRRAIFEAHNEEISKISKEVIKGLEGYRQSEANRINEKLLSTINKAEYEKAKINLNNLHRDMDTKAYWCNNHQDSAVKAATNCMNTDIANFKKLLDGRLGSDFKLAQPPYEFNKENLAKKVGFKYLNDGVNVSGNVKDLNEENAKAGKQYTEVNQTVAGEMEQEPIYYNEPIYDAIDLKPALMKQEPISDEPYLIPQNEESSEAEHVYTEVNQTVAGEMEQEPIYYNEPIYDAIDLKPALMKQEPISDEPYLIPQNEESSAAEHVYTEVNQTVAKPMKQEPISDEPYLIPQNEESSAAEHVYTEVNQTVAKPMKQEPISDEPYLIPQNEESSAAEHVYTEVNQTVAKRNFWSRERVHGA